MHPNIVGRLILGRLVVSQRLYSRVWQVGLGLTQQRGHHFVVVGRGIADMVFREELGSSYVIAEGTVR